MDDVESFSLVLSRSVWMTPVDSDGAPVLAVECLGHGNYLWQSEDAFVAGPVEWVQRETSITDTDNYVLNDPSCCLSANFPAGTPMSDVVVALSSVEFVDRGAWVDELVAIALEADSANDLDHVRMVDDLDPWVYEYNPGGWYRMGTESDSCPDRMLLVAQHDSEVRMGCESEWRASGPDLVGTSDTNPDLLT